MSCDQHEWLHGYFDQELDAARAAAFEAHLEGCPACRGALAEEQSLREAIRSAGLYQRAPQSLRARLLAVVSPSKRHPARWAGLGLAAAMLVALGSLLATHRWSMGQGDEVAAEVLDAHLRSLQLGHLTDVTSEDRHTVKPWFVGKLDFAPPVTDFPQEGFPLVGGRLDVVGGRSVAALVYQRRKHVINLFVWPEAERGDTPANSGAERGYLWLHWHRDGMAFWAISDVAATDLKEFASLEAGARD